MRALETAKRCAYENFEYVDNRSRRPVNSPSAIDKTHLYQLATQMITTVGATDFRYLSQQELDEIGFSNGVFWNSEEFNILGGTLSTEATEGSIRETDAADIGFMNSLCEGDFASKSQTVSVSEVEQRELTGYCVNGEESTQYVAVKTKLKNSVLYNIMIFGPRAKLESAERQRATGNVAIQAAQFFESE